MDPNIQEFDMNTVARGEPLTEWTNDTADVMRVGVAVEKKLRVQNPDTGMITELMVNEPRAFTIPAGATVEIPSVYDMAIHMVLCDHPPPCRPYRCTRPLEVTGEHALRGGIAPLLRRAGQKYGLDESLTKQPAQAPSMAVEKPAEGAADPGEAALDRARARRAGAR